MADRDKVERLVVAALAALDDARTAVIELADATLPETKQRDGILIVPDATTDEQLDSLRKQWPLQSGVVRERDRAVALAELDGLPSLLDQPTEQQRHHEIGLLLSHTVGLHRIPAVGCPLCSQPSDEPDEHAPPMTVGQLGLCGHSDDDELSEDAARWPPPDSGT
jgi:hypothetical protein